MKKLLIPIATLSLLLGACGSDTVQIDETEENTEQTTAAEQDEETEATEEIESSEETVAEEETDENVQEDNDMKVTNVYTDKELGITGTTGSINYEITAVQLKEIVLKSEDAASLFEASVGDTIHAFTVGLAAENTAEEDMTFYAGQAVAITNTKEQLEPDMILSEYIDGEFLGQVRHEGANVYILKNSTVQDLKSIELRISAPNDADFNTAGEEVIVTIEVNN